MQETLRRNAELIERLATRQGAREHSDGDDSEMDASLELQANIATLLPQLNRHQLHHHHQQQEGCVLWCDAHPARTAEELQRLKGQRSLEVCCNGKKGRLDSERGDVVADGEEQGCSIEQFASGAGMGSARDARW